MATATFYINNLSTTTFKQSSTFKSWTRVTNYGVTTHGYTTPTEIAHNKVFATSSIPTGSTITSALLYATVDTGTYGGTAKHGALEGTNSSTLVALDIKAYVTAGADTSVQYFWRSNTGGSYPTGVMNDTVYLDKTGTVEWSAMRLDVVYTPPYTKCTPPGAPTLGETNVTPGKSVTLTWTGAGPGTNNAIKSYDVYSCATSTGTYTKLKNVVSTATGFNTTVTAPSTNAATLYYKIVTVGTQTGFNSDLSAASTALTCSFATPGVPTSVALSDAHVASGNVNLTWVAPSAPNNNPITGYEITGGPATYTTTALTYSVPSAAAGASYTYKVKTKGTYSNSADSAGVTLYTYKAPTAPSATPTISPAKADAGGSVTITWVAGAAGYDNAIAGYTLSIRKVTAAGVESTTGLSVANPAATSCVYTPPSAAMGDKYYFKVATAGVNSISAYTAETAAFTINTYLKLPAPTSVKIGASTALYVLAGSGNQSLTWATGGNNTGTTVAGYEVYQNGVKYGADLAANVFSLSVPMHATAGSNYSYTVKAKSSPAGYTSNASAAAVVYTYSNPTAPSTPTLAAYDGSPGKSVALSWTGAGNGTSYNPIDGYDIYQTTSATSPTFTKIGSVTANTLTYNVTAPTVNGVWYKYKVMTKGTRTNSPLSAESAAITCSVSVPSAPGNVALSAAYAVSGTTVNLTWSASTTGTNNPVTGYEIIRDGAAIATVGPAVLTYAAAVHATNGSSYTYQVKAMAGAVGYTRSSLSTAKTVTTHSKPTPPTAMTGGQTSAESGKTYSISWSGHTTGSAAVTLEVHRSTDNVTYTKLLDNIASSTTTAMVDAPTANNGIYYYKVMCRSSLGVSSYNSALGPATPISIKTVFTAPIAPTVVTGSTNVLPGTDYELSWSGADNGTNNPITRYDVYSSADNYVTPIYSKNTSLKAWSTNVTSHATNGSAYTYKVKVTGTYGGLSAMSTDTHVMTTTVSEITGPNLVWITDASNVKVTTGVAPSTNMKVAWSGAANGTYNNPIAGYNVYESTDGGTTWVKKNTSLVAASPYSSVTSSATNNTSKKYKVEAVATRLSNKETPTPATLTTTVVKPSPPATVSINDPVDVLWGALRTLTWSAAAQGTNNNIKAYRIMRSVDGAAAVQLGADIPSTALSGTLQISAKDLANGTHTYTIHAIGDTSITAEQVSAASSPVTLTSTVTAPTAPTAVIATNVMPNSAQSLTWSGAVNGKNNTIVTYQVWEKIGTGAWAHVGSVGSGTYSLTAASLNGEYKEYKVISEGQIGRPNSGYSNTVRMTTAIGAPSAPTVIGIDTALSVPPNVTRTLSWSGASPGTNNPIKGYKVYLSIDGGAYAQTGSNILSAGIANGSATITSKNGIGTHTYKVVTMGNTLNGTAEVNSAYSGTVVVTSVVGLPSAPSTVSVSNGNGVSPSAVRSLSWSGAAPGTNNPIRGYQLRRSLNDGAYSDFGSPIITTLSAYSADVTALGVDGKYTYKVVTLGNIPGVNSVESSEAGTLITGRVPSTGTLSKSTVIATGSDSVSVTLTTQTGTNYTHKVTWYIPSTAYTSGVISLAAGDYVDAFTVPAAWIEATTSTTTSVAAKCKVETFDGAQSIGINEYAFTVNVPPASTFTLDKSFVSATGLESIKATIVTGHSAYKHTVTWQASTTPLRQYVNAVAASATPSNTQTIAANWCDAAPNAESITATCTVATIKTTAGVDMVIGSTSKTFRVDVPASVVPVITSFTPSQVLPYWGLYVQNKSKCKLTPVITGAYSSTIMSYRITGVNQNSGTLAYSAGTSWTSNFLTASGSITFTIVATDSRGRSATGTSAPITVTAYSAPSIAPISLERANSNGTVNRIDGVYINIKATFTYSAIGTNAITAKAYYRQNGTTPWLPAAGVAISSGVLLTYGDGAIITTSPFQTKIEVTDAFGTTTYMGELPTGAKMFDLRETRAAFGQMAVNNLQLAIPSTWDFVKGTSPAVKVSYEGHEHGTYNRATSALTGANVFSDVIVANGVVTGTATRAITLADLGAAAADHGTHVTYETELPLAAGTASAGADTGVSRGDHVHPLQTSVTGNAGTATTLATARTISLTGDVTGSVSFNGSADVAITAVVTDDSHAHIISNIDGLQAAIDGKTSTGHTHVKANITDFPTSMPASDVYAWAKAATKPSYTYTEVGAAASSHGLHPSMTSDTPDIKQGNTYKFHRTLPTPVADNGNTRWFISLGLIPTSGYHFFGGTVRVGGSYGHANITGYIERSFGGYINSAGSFSSVSSYISAGVGSALDNLRITGPITQGDRFGFYVYAANTNTPSVWFDVYSVPTPSVWISDPAQVVMPSQEMPYSTYAPTLTGTGASGTWDISVTGNAATATRLATARTLTIGDTGKTFNGTGNVSWTLAEIGALPLSGGTLTGILQVKNTGTHSAIVQNSGVAGEFLFGGSTDGSTTIGPYFRVGQTKAQYNNGSGSYDLLHSGNYTTYVTPAGINALKNTSDTFTGTLKISGQKTFNTTTPGFTTYGLHFIGQTTADYATGITWNGGTGEANAQAGIYVQGSGAYGTKMFFATTNAYATGAQTAISIDQTGVTNFVRSRPTALGNVMLDAGNYTSYTVTKAGSGASGTWGISITGNAATATTAGNVTGTVAVANGGTGATTAAGALTNLGLTATAAELNKLDGVTATAAELNYVDGVTSNIQTQLNGKAATHTHPYSSDTHNHDTVYLKLSGGTMTGAITVTDINFNSSNNTDVNYLYFKNYVTGYDALMYSNAVGTTITGSQLLFRQYSRSSTTGGALSFYENFTLPATALNLAASSSYSILTTKATITVAQGGTGATTAAGALTNLGLTATAAELNKLDGATATTAQLNFVTGVTSAIQTQLNAKQKAITYGTGDPSGGSDGDIYIKHV